MDLPKRKHPRLKEYDYSLGGYYYITICTKGNLPILSLLKRTSNDTAAVKLLPIGIIAEQQLFALEERYPFVKIDKYVIMPNHIHVIMILNNEATETLRNCQQGTLATIEACPLRISSRPTLTDIVCTYKSLTTRLANKMDALSGRSLFQTSFYDKVIRDEKSYQEIWQYIDENPQKRVFSKE